MLNLETLHAGLQTAQILQSESSLGDRRQYIGASDIGQCPRKVMNQKIEGGIFNLQTLIRFKRGHLAEEIVSQALHAFEHQRQLELSHTLYYCSLCRWCGDNEQKCLSCGYPLTALPMKAHCDFVFPDDTILEVKTTNLPGIQKTWELQLQTQMYLYQKLYEQNPTGYILTMDIADGTVHLSEPYELDDDDIPRIKEKAIDLWQSLETQQTIPGPLCCVCEYLRNCPAFTGETLPEETRPLLEEYYQASNMEKEAARVKSGLRTKLLDMLEPGRYEAGDFRVQISKRTRTTTDNKAIAYLLKELGQDISEYHSKSSYLGLDLKHAPSE